MKKKITLKDIARELGVSISTVSKALKNSEEIGRDTKEKVQAFAKLYNYRPNNIAVSLQNKHTRNIGVIIPDIVHYFFTTVFSAIEKYANSKGYNVIICVSNESFDKEVINMEMLTNGSVDGFIMSLSAETQQKEDFNHLNEVQKQGIPLVLFDRVTDDVTCDKVILNDKKISIDVIQKFCDSGKRKIAIVTNQGFFSVSDKRAEGYREGLIKNKLKIDPSLELRLNYENIDEKAIKHFFQSNEVDAVFCVNEIFAISCMKVVKSLGKKVPEQISFIGFTNGMLSRFSDPSLTIVAQHGNKMGETAAKMLIEKIETELEYEEVETYRTEVIQATILERGSTVN